MAEFLGSILLDVRVPDPKLTSSLCLAYFFILYCYQFYLIYVNIFIIMLLYFM